MLESHQSPEAMIRPHSVRPLWSVPLRAKVQPVVWIALAVAVLGLDFLTFCPDCGRTHYGDLVK